MNISIAQAHRSNISASIGYTSEVAEAVPSSYTTTQQLPPISKFSRDEKADINTHSQNGLSNFRW